MLKAPLTHKTQPQLGFEVLRVFAHHPPFQNQANSLTPVGLIVVHAEILNGCGHEGFGSRVPVKRIGNQYNRVVVNVREAG